MNNSINTIMLLFIKDVTDPLLTFIKDDPVRPEIPSAFRTEKSRFVAMWFKDKNIDTPSSIVCVSLHDFIPSSVSDLENVGCSPNTAIFYSIWSYSPGAGKVLLINTLRKIKEDLPTITRFLTLSPKTETARYFHIKNGATIFRENADTINYDYSQINLDSLAIASY